MSIACLTCSHARICLTRSPFASKLFRQKTTRKEISKGKCGKRGLSGGKEFIFLNRWLYRLEFANMPWILMEPFSTSMFLPSARLKPLRWGKERRKICFRNLIVLLKTNNTNLRNLKVYNAIYVTFVLTCNDTFCALMSETASLKALWIREP